MAQPAADLHALLDEALARYPAIKPSVPKDGIPAAAYVAVREALKLLSRCKNIPASDADYARTRRAIGITHTVFPRCRNLIEKYAAHLPEDVVSRVLATVPGPLTTEAPVPAVVPVPVAPRKRGRPPKGDKALTAAERTKAYRERAGLRDLRVSTALAERVRRMRLLDNDTVEILLTRALNALERESQMVLE